MSEACLVGNSAPRILFVALVNNVGCERAIAAMSRHGALCAVMSPAGYYCTQMKALARHFVLPGTLSVWLTSLFVRNRLRAAQQDWLPDLVLPMDDIAAWLLRSLALDPSTPQHLAELLVKSCGAPSGYAASIHRGPLMDLAARLGLRKPKHWRISDAADRLPGLSESDFPLFLKLEHTCGGAGVQAVNDRTELRRALASGGGASWRRVKAQAVERLAAWSGFRELSNAELLIQSFAAGRPAFRTVTAWNGRVLEGVSFVAEQVHPEPTGASTVIRHVASREMDEAAAAMTAALGCTGFVSYDFMLDEARDCATLIEVNPRCVGSCHLGERFGHDLCGALAEAVGGSHLPRPDRLPKPQLVALFPKELQRDPQSAYLCSPDVFHDVPNDERDLMASYERGLTKRHGAGRDGVCQAAARRRSLRMAGADTEAESKLVSTSLPVENG